MVLPRGGRVGHCPLFLLFYEKSEEDDRTQCFIVLFLYWYYLQINPPMNQYNIPFAGTILVFWLLLLLTSQPLQAQREYGTCDSTIHPLDTQTTIVVKRSSIHLRTVMGESLLYQFALSDTNHYIRDFDIVQDSLWYAVVGSRYVSGPPTELYYSKDQGQQWQLDTSFYPLLPIGYYNRAEDFGINNLQAFGTDTLVMFLGYYQAVILYSLDAGATWQHWFDNLPAHYHGLFECGDSLYLYGVVGDGFPAYMFAFHKQLLFSLDSANQWDHNNFNGAHPPCYGGIDPNCTYQLVERYRCETHQFFQQKVDSVCNRLVVQTQVLPDPLPLLLYPNPAQERVYLDIGDRTMEQVIVYNAMMQPCVVKVETLSDQLALQVGHLPAGMYYVMVQERDRPRQVLKMVVQP